MRRGEILGLRWEHISLALIDGQGRLTYQWRESQFFIR